MPSHKQHQIRVLHYVLPVLFAAIIGLIGVRLLTVSHADACVPPTNYPPPGTGGMSYVNWHFNTAQNISSVQDTINIYNDPGNTSDEYLQLYDANIDNSGQYYGIQTTGLVLFSRWDTSDTSNVMPGPGSYVTNGTETGSTYVSLRHDFGDLPVGQYTTNMVRANYDGTGDWFDYYVTFPGQSQQFIGAIRFPRANSGVPASFHDGGGTWTEFWDNNNDTTLYPVPLWHVSVKATANNSLIPTSANSSYSTMPNSDTYAESPGGYVDYVIGGSTPRCHPAGYLWQNISQPTQGDVNGDGTVNIVDLSIMASNWGRTGATATQGDLNGDGTINILDLSILATNWGK